MRRTRAVKLSIAGIINVCLVATGFVILTAASAATTPRRIVSGWLPYWTKSSSLASITGNADLWSDASPFWYEATGATTINSHAGAGGPAVRDALKANGIKVLPTVTETLDASQMAVLLSSSSQRAAHVSALVNLVTSNGYDGIDLDYERMNLGGSSAEKAAVRTGFATLVEELGAALDAKGKLLAVSVGPRRSATDANWAVFDYAGIAASADRVRIMTYDYHYVGGSPGAVAPLPWVKQVLDYAVTAIPARRIQIGVPLYGIDWVCGTSTCTTKADGTKGRPLSYKQVETLRLAEGATRQWSATDAAPWFTYLDDDGRKHVVWYNDYKSTKAKQTLVGTYKLAGLAFWAVGSEDTRQWAPLRTYAESIAKKSRSVSISTPPSSMVYGTKVTITGTVKDPAGNVLPGQTVHLQRRSPGGSTWSTVVSTTSSSTGTVSISYTPSANSVFRLYAPSNWTYNSATSAEKTTQVKWKVTLSISDTTPAPGQRIVMSGKVSPVRSGATVKSLKFVDGSWRPIASTTIKSDGSYSFSARAPSSDAALAYRIKASGTAHNATNYSTPTKIAVRQLYSRCVASTLRCPFVKAELPGSTSQRTAVGPR